MAGGRALQSVSGLLLNITQDVRGTPGALVLILLLLVSPLRVLPPPWVQYTVQVPLNESRSFAISAFLGSFLLFFAPPGRAAECEGISSLKLPGTTITFAQTVAPGAFKLPPGVSSPIVIYPYAKLPAFCRMAGTAKPSSDSNIQFEIWMLAAGWNGKLMGEGNGGFAGDIPYMLMSPARES